MPKRFEIRSHYEYLSKLLIPCIFCADALACVKNINIGENLVLFLFLLNHHHEVVFCEIHWIEGETFLLICIKKFLVALL
jgi:hypothetical protein